MIDVEVCLFVLIYVWSFVVFERGEGCKFYDIEGKEYLDLVVGIVVNFLGYGDFIWLKVIND